MIGTYTLKIAEYFDETTLLDDSVTFDVKIFRSLDTYEITGTIPDQSYIVEDPELSLDLPGFSYTPSDFAVNVTYSVSPEAEWLTLDTAVNPPKLSVYS